MNSQKQRSKSNIFKQGYDPNDKNLAFIKYLESEYNEESIKNNKMFIESLHSIKKQLIDIDEAQRQQWAHILELKCSALQKRSKISELKPNIRKLVLLTNQMKIPYDKRLIEKIIKQLYFETYGEEIVQLFKKAGYKTDQYQFVSYSEPWYSRVISYILSD